MKSRPATIAIVVGLALLQLLLSGAVSACARPVAHAGVATHGAHGDHHGTPPSDVPAPGDLAECALMLACATPSTVPPPTVAITEAPHLSPPSRVALAPASPDLDPDTPPPRG